MPERVLVVDDDAPVRRDTAPTCRQRTRSVDWKMGKIGAHDALVELT